MNGVRWQHQSVVKNLENNHFKQEPGRSPRTREHSDPLIAKIEEYCCAGMRPVRATLRALDNWVESYRGHHECAHASLSASFLSPQAIAAQRAHHGATPASTPNETATFAGDGATESLAIVAHRPASVHSPRDINPPRLPSPIEELPDHAASRANTGTSVTIY